LAARQEVRTRGLGALHPALLATLVYRLGPPGRTFRKPWEAQANGQCFLLERAALEGLGGFQRVRDSLCEDVTLARELALAGVRTGFYEAGDLVRVRMYEDWRQAWAGWPRSLPLRDRFWGWRGRLGLLDVALVQALPLPLTLLLGRRRGPPLARAVNAGLLALRLGVLAGTHRAYAGVPWTYWLSPLLDGAAAFALVRSSVRRRHLWRGRPMVEPRR
jgi:dolichol-phosphate mannosyltransferase